MGGGELTNIVRGLYKIGVLGTLCTIIFIILKINNPISISEIYLHL